MVRKSLPLAMLIISLTVAAMLTLHQGARAGGTCAGDKATWNAAEQKWDLSCAGTGCTACRPRAKTCNGTQGTYCTCTANDNCPPGDCCQMMLDSGGQPAFYGTCPNCGLQGSCKICPNTEPATAYAPACGPCIFPP